MTADTAATDSVRWDLDAAVATITLNRPQARNALTAAMKDALLAALQQAAGDPAVRAVILTGAGGAFCAGQDLKEHGEILAGAGDELTGTVRRHYNPIITLLMTMPKPVIAAVNGSAAGAGASLAFACDFRIAARRASFLMAFARVGLAADSGASWTLQRLVGAARATELLMLAEPVGADQALSAGLLTSVVDDAELPAAVAALAARLAAGPTAAYGGIKAQLVYAASHGLAESLENEARVQAKLGETADHRAATQAFLRKEQPVFEGR
ncbi:MAG TPA: enoyl-CoA hydratase-related protein [Streptosporangiaceae bacterium]